MLYIGQREILFDEAWELCNASCSYSISLPGLLPDLGIDMNHS